MLNNAISHNNVGGAVKTMTFDIEYTYVLAVPDTYNRFEVRTYHDIAL